MVGAVSKTDTLHGPGRLMLFEAFVTDQRKTADTRHVEDAHLAIAAFQRGMRDLANFQSSVQEPICLSLLGAGKPVAHEHYDNLSLDERGPNPLCPRINSRSEFVQVRSQGELLRGASLPAGKWGTSRWIGR